MRPTVTIAKRIASLLAGGQTERAQRRSVAVCLPRSDGRADADGRRARLRIECATCSALRPLFSEINSGQPLRAA
jgi:hypothetical protein